MRVLFLTHSFPRHERDLAGSFLLRLATALAGEGVEVRVVAPAGDGAPERARLSGIPVRRFRYAPRSLETLAYRGTMATQVRESWGARAALVGLLGAEIAAARRAAREFRPDVVHAHWWFPNAVAGAFVARGERLPLVTTFHGTDVRMARDIRASRPAFRRAVRRSAELTAVSRWLAETARDLAPERLPLVAPMPAATDLFFPRRDVPRGDRLLFVGRLSVQKGLDLLLRALALLPERVRLDVVGEGPDRTGLERMAADLGVGSRVRWMGELPASALPEMYAAAAALVVPSLEEGLGLVAVEALLCETPVVGFDSGGLADVVHDGVDGMLSGRRDPESLAAALSRFLAREDRGRALGAAGRDSALRTFAPEVAARRYHGVYRDAIASRRP